MKTMLLLSCVLSLVSGRPDYSLVRPDYCVADGRGAETAAPAPPVVFPLAEAPRWRNPPYRAATVWGSETCAPCKAMEAHVGQLVKEGWEIEYALKEKYPEAAKAWGVELVPVLIVHERKDDTGRKGIGSHVGYLDYERLKATLRASGVHQRTEVVQEITAPVVVEYTEYRQPVQYRQPRQWRALGGCSTCR